MEGGFTAGSANQWIAWKDTTYNTVQVHLIGSDLKSEGSYSQKLYLPLGGRHFWSRHAYELAYASQRETKFDRALRRARKLRLRLGGDPADDEYPDKPPRMRWATYNRLLDKLRAADGVADERLRRVLINAQMSGFGG